MKKYRNKIAQKITDNQRQWSRPKASEDEQDRERVKRSSREGRKYRNEPRVRFCDIRAGGESQRLCFCTEISSV